MQQAKMPETLEFLTVAGTPCDPPLLVTRTQHEQILMYIELGAREKADEAIERGRKAYEVYMAQPELPIPLERTEQQGSASSRSSLRASRSSSRSCGAEVFFCL